MILHYLLSQKKPHSVRASTVGPNTQSRIHTRMWCVSDDSISGSHSLGLYETDSQPMKRASGMLEKPKVLTENWWFKPHWSSWCSCEAVLWITCDQILVKFGGKTGHGEWSSWLDFDSGPDLTYLHLDLYFQSLLVQYWCRFAFSKGPLVFNHMILLKAWLNSIYFHPF